MSRETKTSDAKIAVQPPSTAELPAIRQAELPPSPAFPIEARVPQAGEQTQAVGQRVKRTDARAHVLGQTRYIDDLAFPGMLHAKIKRAGIAAARIVRVDTREAESMPGVAAVLTARDIPFNAFGPTLKDQPLLASDRVCHAGDGIAAVAAATEQIAAEAIERIRVDYEPLPAVFDPLEAMRDDAPRVHPPASNIFMRKTIRKGDAETALARADRIVEGRFSTQMVEHAALEPHAAIAAWDASGRLTVHSTLGRITLGRVDIAQTLKIPLNRVRVVATVVGGNFGGKNEISQEPVLALLARKAGRPVKGVFTREEEFTASTTRHPFVMEYRTGVSAQGRILARKVRLVMDGGAYCSWGETTLWKACILSCGPYAIEDLEVEAIAVYTNKTMAGAMRGFGAPQVCFAYESHMDDIAAALKVDPLEIRLMNAYEEGSKSSTGQVLHSVAVKDSLLRAAARFGWKEGGP
jgi:CO/xanthine dehydrogenase Mo-binding subunit